MVWVTCARHFIGAEGNIKVGQRLDIRCQRRLEFLMRGGYVVSETPPEEVGQSIPYGDWQDLTAVVVAGGPSLTQADVDFALASGARVLVVNDGYRLAPTAAMLYACDGRWWDHHIPHVRQTSIPYRVTQDSAAAQKYGLRLVASRNETGLGKTRGTIHQGANSGYQAVNLAYQMGADRIVLLGFDMQPAKDGRTHWFGDHPGAMNVPSPYPMFIEKFTALAQGLEAEDVELVNCSRQTALTCVKRQSLKKAL